jgi:hypothetical protein
MIYHINYSDPQERYDKLNDWVMILAEVTPSPSEFYLNMVKGPEERITLSVDDGFNGSYSAMSIGLVRKIFSARLKESVKKESEK